MIPKGSNVNRRSAKPITMDELKISEAKSMGKRQNDCKTHDPVGIERE